MNDDEKNLGVPEGPTVLPAWDYSDQGDLAFTHEGVHGTKRDLVSPLPCSFGSTRGREVLTKVGPSGKPPDLR